METGRAKEKAYFISSPSSGESFSYDDIYCLQMSMSPSSEDFDDESVSRSRTKDFASRSTGEFLC